MPMLLAFVLRVLALVAGLVLAAGLAVAAALLLAVWLLRSAWARLTGRPLRPFAMRFGPRGGFEHMMRRAAAAATAASPSRTPRADAVNAGRRIGDVTDVRPK